MAATRPIRTKLQLDGGDITDGYRYYRIVMTSGPEEWMTLTHIFVSNDAGTVTLGDGTKIDLPAQTESWYVSPAALAALHAGEIVALGIFYFPSTPYGIPGPDISLADFTVLETAPAQATFAPVTPGTRWPAGGLVFSGDHQEESIPTAVSITPDSDGGAIEEVDWYIPESELPVSGGLFSAYPASGGEVSYGTANTPAEPKPTWATAQSVMTVESTGEPAGASLG